MFLLIPGSWKGNQAVPTVSTRCVPQVIMGRASERWQVSAEWASQCVPAVELHG